MGIQKVIFCENRDEEKKQAPPGNYINISFFYVILDG